MKRIVFMGTPHFAATILQALIDCKEVELAGVVSQPDRPVGRKGKIKPSPVKLKAEEYGIEVFQPESIQADSAVEKIKKWQADLIITAAYGQILSEELLSLPSYGAVNVHASLLPQYRGAAPIHYAILNGDKQTGVSLMYMEKGLDTGDVISQLAYPIQDQQTTGDLFDILADLGAELLISQLEPIFTQKVQATAQDDERATYAPAIDKRQEEINWQYSAQQISQFIRALSPEPGAYTYLKGERFKIWQAEAVDESTSYPPATVVRVEKKQFYLSAGQGTVLKITEVQPAGKKAMPAANYLNGAGQFLEEGYELDASKD